MSIRTERLGSLLKEDLGNLLREYQKDNMITITSVNVTPDLSIAKVYLSVFAPGGDKQQVYEHVVEHGNEIRFKLADLIRNQVRKIPELHFYMDDTSEYVNKMEELFQKVREERKTRED